MAIQPPELVIPKPAPLIPDNSKARLQRTTLICEIAFE